MVATLREPGIAYGGKVPDREGRREKKRKRGFAMVVREIEVDSRVSPMALRVYIRLARHADGGGGLWVAQTKLANDLGVDPDSVGRAIRQLRSLGYVERTHRGRSSSDYRLIGHALVEDPDPTELTGDEPRPDQIDGFLDSNPDETDGFQADLDSLPDQTDGSYPTKLTGRDPTATSGPYITDPVEQTREQKDPTETSSPPDPAPSSKPKAGPDPRLREVFDYYRSRIQPAARVFPGDKIRCRLKTFSVEELMAGIDHFADDSWWMEHNAARGAAWFFESDKRSEQFLNLTPRKENGNGRRTRAEIVESLQPRLLKLNGRTLHQDLVDGLDLDWKS